MVCGLVGLLAGCTHVQLRKNSVREATTVGDLQLQEVMDNLAMFVYDYNSMPYFSYPNQGVASVTDQASGGITPSFGRPITSGSTSVALSSASKIPTFFTPPFFLSFMLSSLGLSTTAQRQCVESFTMTPINDPRKLELMRCAYQTAVSNCGYGPASKSCPDCQARFNTFYTGDPDGKISQMTGGTITSDCLKGSCWFHVGCKKDVPKDCGCIYVGCYCDVYVWVCAEGRDELTKLALAILDYAVHDSPARLTKDVTYYVDALGLPTTQKDGVGVVKATIAINEQNESLLSIPPAQEVDLERQLQDRIKRLSATLEQTKDSEQKKNLSDEIEDAKQKLYFLDQQLRNGGLKEQFAPPGPATVPPFSVIPQLQQQLNAFTPQSLAPPAQ
ncbi:MAG TPA: hypothetical protein VMJ32_00160 [Pirellulales bacterium]|nr:hypothetical protein [Pirellulales bacterium]